MGDAAQRLSVAADRHSMHTAIGWPMPSDLEAVIDAALVGIDDLCGSPTSLLLVNQPEIGRLVTLASRGYAASGTGSEVDRRGGCDRHGGGPPTSTMRIGNLQRMLSYAAIGAARRRVTLPVDEIRSPRPARSAPQPDRRTDDLARRADRRARGGEQRGVVVRRHARGTADRSPPDSWPPARSTGSRWHASDHDHAPSGRHRPTSPGGTTGGWPSRRAGDDDTVVLRHYAVDGSTFLDDGYLIRGVAGRLLSKLAGEYTETGRTEFTNREVRLAASSSSRSTATTSRAGSSCSSAGSRSTSSSDQMLGDRLAPC